MGKDLKGKELGNGLSQRKDGKYSARIVIRNKRIEQYFEKPTEARRWLNEKQYEKEHGTGVDPTDITLSEWFQQWIETYKEGVIKYNTCQNYKTNFRLHIEPLLGHMQLQDIRQGHCQSVLNCLYEKGTAYTNMKLCRVIMHLIFEAAVTEELLLKNPVTKQVVCRKRETKERRALSQAEQELFLQYAKTSVAYPIFLLALTTGMRSGELCGLQWNDVDLREKKIHVVHNLQHAKETGQRMETPKSKAGVRTIPLTDVAVDLLKKQREKVLARPKGDYRDFVFLTRGNLPYYNYCLNESLRKITNRINKTTPFEPISMHGLRHTFATRSIENGVKPNVLQKILGHSSLAMTMDLYVHTLPDEIEKEMQKNNGIGVKMA